METHRVGAGHEETLGFSLHATAIHTRFGTQEDFGTGPYAKHRRKNKFSAKGERVSFQPFTDSLRHWFHHHSSQEVSAIFNKLTSIIWFQKTPLGVATYQPLVIAQDSGEFRGGGEAWPPADLTINFSFLVDLILYWIPNKNFVLGISFGPPPRPSFLYHHRLCRLVQVFRWW